MLKKKLREYLECVLPSLEEPVLCRMWEVYQRSGRRTCTVNESVNEDYGELRENYQVVLEENKIITRKLKDLREDWLEFGENLLGVAKELLLSVNEKSASEELLRNAKQAIKKSEAFLSKSKKAENKYNDESRDEFEEELNLKLSQKKAECKNSNIEESSNSALMQEHAKRHGEVKGKEIMEENKVVQNPLYLRLDYEKIKRSIFTSTDNLKLCTLLQALTYRLTNKHGKAKIQRIAEFIQNDILDHNENCLVITFLLHHPIKKYIMITIIELLSMR